MGTSISKAGRDSLDLMIDFLKAVPCRIVISENNQDSQLSSDLIGIERAWAVAEYLRSKGVEKDSFSVTGASMSGRGGYLKGRNIVFTLLDRSVYE